MKQTKSKNRTIKTQSSVFVRGVDLKDKNMKKIKIKIKIWNKQKLKTERSRPSQVCLRGGEDRKRHRAVSRRLSTPSFRSASVFLFTFWYLSSFSIFVSSSYLFSSLYFKFILYNIYISYTVQCLGDWALPRFALQVCFFSPISY